MFNNYLYLKRAVIELKSLLIDYKIIDVFSQEKDKSVFILEKKDHQKYLIFNTTANQPYILLRSKYSKAKKNTYDFFKDLKYKNITGIKISNSDRIIKLSIGEYSVLFSIRGAKTNLFLLKDNSVLESFKKIKEDDQNIFEKEIQNVEYDDRYSPINTALESFNKNELKNIFPFINSFLLNEIKIRTNENTSLNQAVNDVFYGLMTDNIAVGYLESKLRFIPESFVAANELSDKIIFDGYFEALNHYLTSNYKKDKVDEVYKIINSELEKKLSYLSNKINNLEDRVNKGSRENDYYKMGNLLLSNLHLITNDLDTIEVFDFETDNNIKIKIDKKLSPSENASRYFDKAKDEKKNYQISKVLFNQSKQEYFALLEIKSKFDQNTSLEDLRNIKEQLRIKDKILPKMNKEEINIKYYHYVIEDKYHVYVGRDSKNNDLLTLKFAKQNDLWFHARGLPGSHVVLRIENSKEVIPKNIIKATASIAAYYSKAKTAGTVPVSYTFKKFVIKKKGMEPGKVLLLKESSILVKPEIPSNVVLENDEY